KNPLPGDIPRNPQDVYKSEWVSWPAFLGADLNAVYWTESNLLHFLNLLQDLAPTLSDADLWKLANETKGVLWALGLRTSGIAEILKVLRTGVLPEVKVREEDVEEDDAAKDSDYETPESEVDLHAADRAQRKGIPLETIQYIVESQVCNLRAKWF